MGGVTAEISFRMNIRQTGTNDLLSLPATAAIAELVQFEEGTNTVGKADILFADTRTLAASATENIDLSGALTDAFGASIVAAELVAIYVKASAANTNNVNVTRPASNGVPIFLAAGDGVSIQPGEWFEFVSQKGIAVTAATGDLITITNAAGSTSVTYNIIVIGRTVAA